MRVSDLPFIVTDRALEDWSDVRFFQEEPYILIVVSPSGVTWFQVLSKSEFFGYAVGMTAKDREAVYQALEGNTLPVTVESVGPDGERLGNWVFGRNANGFSGISVVDPEGQLPMLLAHFQRGNWEIARRSFYDSVGTQVYP